MARITGQRDNVDSRMIKTIIFDMGKVIIPFDFQRGYDRMAPLCGYDAMGDSGTLALLRSGDAASRKGSSIRKLSLRELSSILELNDYLRRVLRYLEQYLSSGHSDPGGISASHCGNVIDCYCFRTRMRSTTTWSEKAYPLLGPFSSPHYVLQGWAR